MKVTKNVINNILGKKKQGKDSDGDGVIDSKDCQPHNPMRQDVLTNLGPKRIQQLNRNISKPTPQQVQETSTIEKMAKAKIRSKIF